MRWSQAFIPTLRDDPADAEAVSHKLMLRAGMIRQLGAVLEHLTAGLGVQPVAVQIGEGHHRGRARLPGEHRRLAEEVGPLDAPHLGLVAGLGAHPDGHPTTLTIRVACSSSIAARAAARLAPDQTIR